MKGFEEQGFTLASRIIEPRELATVARALSRFNASHAGLRNLLELPWVRTLAGRLKQRLCDARLLPTSFVAVQCTLFDKTANRNWLVALHQDVAIPVRTRVDHPSLRVWSKKEGIDFVQAPVDVLDQLVAVRVHIDDCAAHHGPLKVVPGSHRRGRLNNAAALQLRQELGEVQCVASAGDAFLMRPLLLHSSSKAVAPSHRRVLHLLLGPKVLPYGLEWRSAV